MLLLLLYAPAEAKWTPDYDPATGRLKNLASMTDGQTGSGGSQQRYGASQPVNNTTYQYCNFIVINWPTPQGFTNGVYRVFRNPDGPAVTGGSNRPEMVAELGPTVTQYTDKVTGPIPTWYMVICITSNRDQLAFLTTGKATEPARVEPAAVSNRTGTEQVQETPQVPPLQVSNLSFTVSTDTGIRLTWQGSEDPGVVFDIYRSEEVFPGTNIAVPPTASVAGTVWSNLPDHAGAYYFAVTPRSESRTNRHLEPGRNSLSVAAGWAPRPPAIAAVSAVVSNAVTNLPVPASVSNEIPGIDYEVWYTNVLVRAYVLRQYDFVVKEAETCLTDPGSPENVRNQAALLRAKSYYFMGQEYKALKLFSELRKSFPQESTFWINTIGNKP